MDRDEDERRGLTRRELLKVAAVGAAASVVGCGGDADALGVDASTLADASAPDDAEVGDAGVDAERDGGREAPPGVRPEEMPESAAFPLGVASGDVRADGVVLWTRYDGGLALGVTVWRMEDDEYVARVFEGAVAAADGGFVHAEVPLPVAGARYRFVFVEAGSARSAIGQFRAAFDESTLAPITLGVVSCTRNGRSFDTLARAGARDDLDAFLLLGDTTYADGARTLDEYREKWVEVLDTDGYRALRASTSLYATWDDHELDNNWDPESYEPSQIRAATDAFFEATPLRRFAAAPDRIFRSVRWGRTLELFVLDTRSERLPSTRRGPDATYVSRAQLEWLKAGLAGSEARFKVVMNSIGITDFPTLLDVAQAQRWEGYAAQRDEILAFIDDARIPGLLWVAGDFHFASLGRVGAREGAPGWNQWEVLVGPGAQISNPLFTNCRPPQFPFSSGRNNYTELGFDPDTGEITIRWIDGEGVAFATETIRP